MTPASQSLAPVVLFEDNHVIAIRKPAGMLSQGDLSGDLDVLTFVKAFVKRRDGKPGNVYLGLVHRLDRPVGGAMVLAKTSKAASRLSAQLRERSAEKVYRAVVEGTPQPDRAELVHRLERDRDARVTKVVAASGKEARLSYRVLESAGARSLVEVKLETGLPHQIRAQLAAVGHPIVGDRKYGSKEAFAGGPGTIALYSRSLTFAHPVSRERVTVIADPPEGWPWN